MKTFAGLRATLCTFAAALCLAALPLHAQLPMEPLHQEGDSVTPAFEGWWTNPDGSFSILVGYFNRNLKQEVDIPVGPNNRIEPGGPDRGQPTHFYPRRNWGVFTFTVPKDTPKTQKFTWTIVANGKQTQVPLSLDPLWEISPFSEVGVGNTPPVVSFTPNGPTVQGPKPMIQEATVTLPDTLSLPIWVADDAKTAVPQQKRLPAVNITWSKFRGPGPVKFSAEKPALEKTTEGPAQAEFMGKATVTATFTQPGEYMLRVVANDYSGDGGLGFQCCWTNAMIKVTVKPAAAAK